MTEMLVVPRMGAGTFMGLPLSSPGSHLLAVRFTASLQVCFEGAVKDCILLLQLAVLDHVIVSQTKNAAIINFH